MNPKLYSNKIVQIKIFSSLNLKEHIKLAVDSIAMTTNKSNNI